MAITEQIRAYWDTDAATYDRTPIHRPTSAAEQAAWAALLRRLLPPAPARILDCGAGTGFLSLIAAAQGHAVTALDVSPAMLDRLRHRAEDERLTVEVMEGSATEPPGGPFDAVMERHLLWTLPDPVSALGSWRRAAPDGRLVLIEGLWGSVDPFESARARGRYWVQRARVAGAALGLRAAPQPEHHADYDEELRSVLPFGRGTPPDAVVRAVAEAGWRHPAVERLRDVEWAANLTLPLPERIFGVHPRFAVTAE